jgi:hypothetical protein
MIEHCITELLKAYDSLSGSLPFILLGAFAGALMESQDLKTRSLWSRVGFFVVEYPVCVSLGVIVSLLLQDHVTSNAINSGVSAFTALLGRSGIDYVKQFVGKTILRKSA